MGFCSAAAGPTDVRHGWAMSLVFTVWAWERDNHGGPATGSAYIWAHVQYVRQRSPPFLLVDHHCERLCVSVDAMGYGRGYHFGQIPY
jgi:hypothetical protein